MNNNFNRDSLRSVPAIDLAERARQAKERADAAAVSAAQIQLVVQEIPNSCLYEIYMKESLDASRNADILAHALVVNDVGAIAKVLSIAFDGPMPPAFKQQAPNLASLRIGLLMGMAQQKATLALAAAQMTAIDLQRTPDDSVAPRWYGPAGTVDGGYGKTYLDGKMADTDLAVAGDAQT